MCTVITKIAFEKTSLTLKNIFEKKNNRPLGYDLLKSCDETLLCNLIFIEIRLYKKNSGRISLM